MKRTDPNSMFFIVTEDIAMSSYYLMFGAWRIIQAEKLDDGRWQIEAVKTC